MGTPILWVGFNLLVLLALALDLGVFHRKAHKIKLGEAVFGSALWITLALIFGWCVWHWNGEQRGLEYFTGYVIEKALSVDNLFVFLVIFRTFQVPEAVQHRVLAWGILGALVMRGVMIAAGAVLVARFQWILPAFGVFLVYTGLHMLWKRGKAVHYEKNPIFPFASSPLRVTKQYSAGRVYLKNGARHFATPPFPFTLTPQLPTARFA